MKRVLRIAAALIVLAVMLVPSVAPAAAAAAGQPAVKAVGRPFIHPALLNPDSDVWKYGALVDKNSTLTTGFEKFLETARRHGLNIEIGGKVARIMVVLPAKVDAATLRAVAKAMPWVSAVLPDGPYTLVIGLATPKTIQLLANTPGVLAVVPDARVDTMIHMRKPAKEPDIAAKNHPVPIPASKEQLSKAKQLQAGGAAGIGFHYTVNITRAIDVWKKYGIEGQGATIAIIDTGVDYASPALGEDAIARDSNGLPMILDMGSPVFFPVVAKYVGNNTIFVNFTGAYAYLPLYEFFYVSDGTAFDYFNGNMVFYNVTGYYKIPASVAQALARGAAPIRFGVAFETVLTPAGLVIVSAPAIIVDSNADHYYDTIYLDLSTAAYYLNQTFNGTIEMPAPSSPDYSFADEKPLTYGSEIAARDLDGDGYYDLSFGALAGYAYDSFGYLLLAYTGQLDQIFQGAEPGYLYGLGELTATEQWDWEHIGMVWPGIDVKHGSFAALEYDFYSHGTFCATTAAGRPVPAYTGYGEGGVPVSLVSGEAPMAKIAAANMFFSFDTLADIYFFSGFDLMTPYAGFVTVGKARVPVPMVDTASLTIAPGYEWYWKYTGRHQADITSNSYGISMWPFIGFIQGRDPISLVFDYTSAVSGTAHFVAMGNGGPGYGTVTVPAASTLAISVGAATEFTYRPMFGYLPGGNREVVYWSDRGPTAAGVAKPDVVAIGSFAFAVGRVWDSMAYGELNGNPVYTTDLFGGTSQATPMAAGVGALVVSAYKAKYHSRMPAYLLKTVLMNAAENMDFDPVTQGAGFVDALKAVENVLEGGTRVYNFNFKEEYLGLMGLNDFEVYTYGHRVVPSRFKWYEPKIIAYSGMRPITKAILMVEGSGRYTVQAVDLRKTYEKTYTVTVPVGQLGFIGMMPVLVLDPNTLAKYDMVRIYAYYPYKYFDPEGRAGYGGSMIFINGIELWAWFDINRDGVVQPNETARIQYDLRGANAFRLDVGNITRQLAEIRKLVSHYLGIDLSTVPAKLLVVYRVYGNDWAGTNTAFKMKIVVEGYNFKPSKYVRAFPPRLYVHGRGKVMVLVRAPFQPGIYESYVVIKGGKDNAEILVPVSIVAARRMTPTLLKLWPNMYKWVDGDEPYHITRLFGAFDYTWRYESGDWRSIPIYIPRYLASRITALVVEVKWSNATNYNYTSNLDAMVFGPKTVYYVDPFSGDNSTGYWLYQAGSFKVGASLLGGELSADFTVFWDEPAPGVSRFVVPVDGPGLYYIVVRNIQFSGEKPYDDYTVTVRVISAYHTPRIVVARPGYTARASMLIRGYYGPYVKSLELFYDNETLIADRLGRVQLYSPNATFIDMNVTNVVKRGFANFGLYRATLLFRVSSDAPVSRGQIVYPVIVMAGNLPVFSIGIDCCGSRYPFLWYNLLWTTVPLRIIK